MNHIQLALLPAAGDSSEALKLVSTEGVQPLVSGRVLDEPGLVTEPVVAVLPHAVEVRLTGQSQWFCELHFSFCCRCHGQIGMGVLSLKELCSLCATKLR